MQPIKYGKMAFFLVLLMAQTSFSVIWTVKKAGGANCTSIQEAVDKASPNDEIVITDAEVYEEQVTIDSLKTGLWIHKDPSLSQKPTIKYRDTKNTGPKTAEEALDPDEKYVTYDQNGALRLMFVQNVRIEGIIIDGGEPYVFGNPSVWEGRYDLLSGNAALMLLVSGNVIVRDCELRNAYFGIFVKDRNEGGVFANPNPADVDPDNIIPFSWFAMTGNHLIEHNRFHDNSYGMFFESTWDMGSTVRYNLFYEVHHTAKMVTTIQGLDAASEKGNQTGGAFLFKDQVLSPVAIYNNTFWHCSAIFVGNWKAGGQHLIFNNIYAEPDDYWDQSSTIIASHCEMSSVFANRMHNSVYASFKKAPTQYDVQITDGLKLAQTGGGTYNEGALITPFPASAEIRWVETKFLSTDPTSSDFLTPDWSDDMVIDYIVDKGWEEAGVKDPDGSRADLGAIPMKGGRPVDVVTIRPTIPMEVENGTATVTFSVDARIGTMTDIKVVMFGAVTNLDTTSDIFGSDGKPIPTTRISKVSIGTHTVTLNANTNVQVKVPATGDYAFLEMIIEGTGTDGQTYTSAVGFLPYRKLEYTMKVTVLDKTTGKAINEVDAGEVVTLKVETFKSGVPFTQKVDPTRIRVQTPGAVLRDANMQEISAVPGGITDGSATVDVVFTKVPPGKVEFVLASGRYIFEQRVIAFLGSSDGITIHAGPPDSIMFQDPGPLGGILNPGTMYTVKVQAFDQWGNAIDQPTPINCVSTKPDIGDMAYTDTTTDSVGMAIFRAYVKGGDKGDTVPMVATLTVKPERKANAFLIVGEPKDRIWIYYSDTLAYNETVTIDTCSGIRVPVTLRASRYRDSVSTDRVTAVNLNLGNLKAYASPTSMDPITAVQLVAGQAKIYIVSTVKNITNGTIGVLSTDPTLQGGERSGINFYECFTMVEKGAFFANNGKGAVDAAVIYYTDDLTADEVPDSVLLCWPNSSTDCRTIHKLSGNITLDADNAKRVIINLPTPFAEAVTKYSGSNADLGTTYWVNPATPDAPTIPQSVAMQDSVGPLLMTATLIERIEAGDDSMIITFTETVEYSKVIGQTLTLIQNGAPVQLTIKDAKPGDGQAIIVTVDNSTGAAVPAAGDSLMITAAGTISDNNGNRAHPENRPVVIQLKSVAPSIVSAFYRDGNGDGIVDTVRVQFNKAVDINQMPVKINFNGKDGSEYAAPEDMLLVDGSGNTVVDIKISHLFPKGFMQDKTNGTMLVVARFLAYDNTERSITAEDKAAPVLVAVEYHFGKIGENTLNNEPDEDTLYAKYSEPLTGVPGVDVPIAFITSLGVPYQVPVFTPTGSPEPKYAPRIVASGPLTGYYLFIVSGKDLLPTPEGGDDPDRDGVVTNPKDSVWINTAVSVNNAVDQGGNAQTIPTNKRVALVTKKPPFSLKVVYGPNPFAPGAANFRIIVTAKTKAADQTTFRYKVAIFDKVGNLIHEIPEAVVDDTINVTWDGVNKSGRLVGNGTYLAKLYVHYWNPLKAETVYFYPQNIMIGVKRTK